MFCCRCFILFCQCEISQIRRPTGVKFCTVICIRPNFIMPVHNLGEPTPTKFQGPKTCKIWPDFGRLQTLGQISPEQTKIFKIGLAFGEKSLVNFGPIYIEISMRNHTRPNRLFRETIFRPLTGAALPNICMRERITKSCQRTPHWGSGDMGPPYNFFQRGVQNWLKFQQVHSYNFGGSGSSSTILCHMMVLKVGMINYVQILGPAPQKFGRAKNWKVWPSF